MKFVLFLFSAWVLSYSSTPKCLKDPDFYRFLSGKLGTPHTKAPVPIYFQCDTMEVAKGSVASVYPNTLLSWSDPKSTNTILVEGVLELYGTSTEKIQVSGHFDSTFYISVASKEGWAGFVVLPGGSLLLENTSIHGAKRPIHLRNGNLSIQRSIFYGATHFNLGTNDQGIPLIHSLKGKEYISNFNLEKFLEMQKSNSMMVSSPSPQLPKLFKNKWTYILPLGLIGTGVAGYWIYTSQPEKQQTVEGKVGFE